MPHASSVEQGTALLRTWVERCQSRGTGHPVSKSPPAPEPAVAPGSRARILIVDDDPGIVSLLKGFLESKGYETITASDGDEALRQVWQEKPKVVLLDICMPRKGGLEVLKEIKLYHKDVGVIIVTAVEDEAVESDALRMGAFDYILKPFDLQYLEKVLWWKLRLMD